MIVLSRLRLSGLYTHTGSLASILLHDAGAAVLTISQDERLAPWIKSTRESGAGQKEWAMKWGWSERASTHITREANSQLTDQVDKMTCTHGAPHPEIAVLHSAEEVETQRDGGKRDRLHSLWILHIVFYPVQVSSPKRLVQSMYPSAIMQNDEDRGRCRNTHALAVIVSHRCGEASECLGTRRISRVPV